MRQADPLNEEEVQNQKETKKQITQEEYTFFTCAQSHKYVKRVPIHNCIDLSFSFTPSVIECSFDSRQINK